MALAREAARRPEAPDGSRELQEVVKRRRLLKAQSANALVGREGSPSGCPASSSTSTVQPVCRRGYRKRLRSHRAVVSSSDDAEFPAEHGTTKSPRQAIAGIDKHKQEVNDFNNVKVEPSERCGFPSESEREALNAEIYGAKGSPRRSPDQVFTHPYIQKLLAVARSRVTLGAEWVICIRTYGRSGLQEDHKKGSGQSNSITELTLTALRDAGLDHRYRRRIHIFVSHEDPHQTSGRYEAALGPEWAGRVIVGVKGADLQARFIEECFCQGQHVVVCDDNIKWLQVYYKKSPQHWAFRQLRHAPCELEELFALASQEMNARGAHLWGISASNNLMYGSDRLTESLGLIYGAFFGFLCLHEPDLYTHFGQVKDDLERTLRYWHRDRIVLRFKAYAVRKPHKPGKFGTKKGGISAALGAEAHGKEASEAVCRIVEGFAAPYTRLPAPGDQILPRTPGGKTRWKSRVSDVGVVFCASTIGRHCLPRSKLMTGYVCLQCRMGKSSESSIHSSSDGKAKASCSCVDPNEREAWQVFRNEGFAATSSASLGTSPAVAKVARMLIKQELLLQWVLLSPGEREPYRTAGAANFLRTQWRTSKRVGSLSDGGVKRMNACCACTALVPLKKKLMAGGAAAHLRWPTRAKSAARPEHSRSSLLEPLKSKLDMAEMVIEEARAAEKRNQWGQALECYNRGLKPILEEILPKLQKENPFRGLLQKQLQDYLERAEQLKDRLDSYKASGCWKAPGPRGLPR